MTQPPSRDALMGRLEAIRRQVEQARASIIAAVGEPGYDQIVSLIDESMCEVQNGNPTGAVVRMADAIRRIADIIDDIDDALDNRP